MAKLFIVPAPVPEEVTLGCIQYSYAKKWYMVVFNVNAMMCVCQHCDL